MTKIKKNESKPLIDWFGETLEPEMLGEATPLSPNPCVQLYGPGPANTTCNGCAHLAGISMSRTFWKCGLRKVTHGPASDHKRAWQACAKYEPREKDIPLYDGR